METARLDEGAPECREEAEEAEGEKGEGRLKEGTEPGQQGEAREEGRPEPCPGRPAGEPTPAGHPGAGAERDPAFPPPRPSRSITSLRSDQPDALERGQGGGGDGDPKAEEKVQRSHLRTVRPAALPSYLCCRHVGRLHGSCLAYGAAAPSREKRQSHKHPPKGANHPTEGREARGSRPRSGPLGPPLSGEDRARGAQTVGGLRLLPRCPSESGVRGISPVWASSPESVGLNRAPPAGRGHGVQACPPLTEPCLGQERELAEEAGR